MKNVNFHLTTDLETTFIDAVPASSDGEVWLVDGSFVIRSVDQHQSLDALGGVFIGYARITPELREELAKP